MEQDRIDRICIYCENATPLYGGDTVLCVLCGVTACDNHCHKFSYDPLKRIPPKSAPKPVLDYIDIDTEENKDDN